MSRNLFSRYSAPKKSVISRTTEREVEREAKKLEGLEDTTKKLYKDMKRCIESCTATAKAERKIPRDLLASALCQQDTELKSLVEDWDHAAVRLEHHQQELNSCCQKVVMEPTKKLSSIFPGVQAAIKKRQQSLQEYNKCQAKIDKYQERERTGGNVVKRETSKKVLQNAKEEFETQHSTLMEEMPKLYEARTDYFQPSFEALVRSQVSYHAEAFKIYSELSHQMTDKDGLSDEDYSAVMQQKLTDIKALSITVD
ncbi:LOW QUALITY PROTEIN: bridging integrator 3-like [Liolophura sinensis]|uniref:LOW QUALITY PROTEIN: bridging integrator 3-like n=1 Tax=Liolophura sinensis TaxID=3198878 RepID=UPI0031592EFF